MRKKMISILTAVIMLSVSMSLIVNEDVEAKGRRCQYQSCKNAAIENGVYCSSHTCIIPGCISLRYSSNCSYCYSHRCNYSGCTSKRESGSDFCSAHKTSGEKDKKKLWEKVKNSSSSKSKSSKKGSGTKSKSSSKKK